MKLGYLLSGVVALLGAIASLAGLLCPQLYRDSASLRPQICGQDWVTLVVGVPLLVVSLLFSVRGSLRGRLVWLGALAYFLYTYASYALGVAYNDLYLLYVALFSLSLFALIRGMMSLNIEDLAWRFSEKTPERIIAGYFVIFGLVIALLWLWEIIPWLLAREPPDYLMATGEYTMVVPALDLGLLVPVFVLTGILLWKRKRWGYGLAGLMLVKAATLGMAMLAMIFFMARAGNPVPLAQVIFFAALALFAVALSIVFLSNLQEEAA